ncbi:unnamed protein product [Periconia digitata]|uniref:Uncharacterized protein n=1 Tax=Periconia digitata TaxID=1303443 RepID=A0A9W4UN02_9PLEO|nr:unnamed protein product [Periconia digitata]
MRDPSQASPFVKPLNYFPSSMARATPSISADCPSPRLIAIVPTLDMPMTCHTSPSVMQHAPFYLTPWSRFISSVQPPYALEALTFNISMAGRDFACLAVYPDSFRCMSRYSHHMLSTLLQVAQLVKQCGQSRFFIHVVKLMCNFQESVGRRSKI